MPTPLKSQLEIGESKLRDSENFIIFDKVQVPSESTSQAEKSQSLDKPASKPTKSARRHSARLGKDDALGIIQSAVHTAQKTGISFAIINLPNNSFGIVVRNGWACAKCGSFHSGIGPLGNLCEACSKLSKQE